MAKIKADPYLAYSDLTEAVYIVDGGKKIDVTNQFYFTVVNWLQRQGESENIERVVTQKNKNPFWQHIISMKSTMIFKDGSTKVE